MLAGFVDAGFLKAQGAKALKREVRETQVSAAPFVEWLESLAAGHGEDFLRAYWYDGAFDPSDARFSTQRRYFDAIEDIPGVSLRLGYLVERTPGWHYAVRKAVEACGIEASEFEKHFSFKPDLTQKGVDALITLDLIHLAERKAYDWAVLVAGDRDLAEAVWTAQAEGRKFLLATPPGAGLARELRREADELLTIPVEVLEKVLAAPKKATPQAKRRR